MTKYTLFKIKEGKRQIWIDWCLELQNKYKEEATKTLEEENLIGEKCVIYDEYVFYKHTTVAGKEKRPFNPNIKINLKHSAKLKECLEKVSVLQLNGAEIEGYSLNTKKQ